MRQVLTLLNFHRAVKSPNLSLYLAILENLATYFFANYLLDYARNILDFTTRALAARETHPDIWKRHESGEFSVTKRTILFTSIGTDQAEEHDNKTLKGEGGLQGITNKPSILRKYCLAAPHLRRLVGIASHSLSSSRPFGFPELPERSRQS